MLLKTFKFGSNSMVISAVVAVFFGVVNVSKIAKADSISLSTPQHILNISNQPDLPYPSEQQINVFSNIGVSASNKTTVEPGRPFGSTASTTMSPTPTASSHSDSIFAECPVNAYAGLGYEFAITGPENKLINVSITSLLDVGVGPNPSLIDAYRTPGGQGQATAGVGIYSKDEDGNYFHALSHSAALYRSNRFIANDCSGEDCFNTEIQLDNDDSSFVYFGDAETASFTKNYVDTLSLMSNRIYYVGLSAATRALPGSSYATADPYIQILNDEDGAYQLNFSPGIGNNPDPTAPVPEPTTMLLFGTGIIGIVGSRRRKIAQK